MPDTEPAEAPKKRRRTSRTKAESEQCQDRAHLLKVQGGLSFDAIAKMPDPTGKADQLYANASAARQAYLAAAARMRGQGKDEPPLTTTERRALQDDRYERLLQAWLPKAISGSGEATDRVLRALSGQAALYGLNTKPASAERDDTGQEDVADELADRRAQSREAARAAMGGAAAAAPPAATRRR